MSTAATTTVTSVTLALKCPDCSRDFKTKSALKQHLKTHEDVREKSVSYEATIVDLKRQLQAAHEENIKLIAKVESMASQLSKIKEIVQ